jgi:outer membrane protein OmpA-like peptidoglycan-associated protein
VINPNGQRWEVLGVDVAPQRDNPNGDQTARESNAIITQRPVLRQAQPRPNDPAAAQKLDSLLAQVATLRAQLDTGRSAPPTARFNATEAATAGVNSPAVRSSADQDSVRALGAYPEPGAAPASYTGLNAVQDQLAALYRSVDRLEKEMVASLAAAPLKAPALRKLLPYGPLLIYFPLNSAAIHLSDKQRLASLVGTAGMDTTAVVQVKGFADQTGNAAYNLELSRRRAEGIRDYLINSLGVAPQRVIVNYFGQAMATRQQANPYDRRVELEVYVQ